MVVSVKVQQKNRGVEGWERMMMGEFVWKRCHVWEHFSRSYGNVYSRCSSIPIHVPLSDVPNELHHPCFWKSAGESSLFTISCARLRGAYGLPVLCWDFRGGLAEYEINDLYMLINMKAAFFFPSVQLMF